MRYNEFLFETYHYVPANNSLSLIYRFRDGPPFEEQLIL